MKLFPTRSNSDLRAAIAGVPPGGSVVLIVGSAVSMSPPSNLPSVGVFKAGVFGALSDLKGAKENPVTAGLLQRYGRAEYWRELRYRQRRQLPFEAFLGALHEAAPGVVKEIFTEGFCAPSFRQANINHRGIAMHARDLAAREVRVDVVTTNYDLCLESAFEGVGLSLAGVPPGRGRTRELISAGNPKVTLRKVHGSADDFGSMVFTFRAVSQCRADASIERALECLRSANVVIVAGYSGSDLDIRPTIAAMLADNAAPQLYWLHHDEAGFWADLAEQPFRQRFVQSIAKWSSLVPCNLKVADSGQNYLALSAGAPASAPSGEDFHSVIKQAVGRLSMDDLRVFLALIGDSLESSDATALLEDHPRRLALAHVVLEAHAHSGNNDEAIALGAKFLTDRRLRPWPRARIAARCAADRVMQGKFTPDLLPLNLRAVGEYLRAWVLTPRLWLPLSCKGRLQNEFRDTNEAEDYEAALDAQHCLLHNLIRVAAFAVKRRSGTLRSASMLLWRLVAWYVVHRLKRCAEKRPALRDEGSMLREVLEARCYTGHFPADTDQERADVGHIMEMLEQVEAGHAVACVHLTLGRGYTFQRKYDAALREFLLGLKWVAGGEERNTIQKCAGNAARLAFYLRDGKPVSYPGGLVEPAGSRLAYGQLMEFIDTYPSTTPSTMPAESLLAECLSAVQADKRAKVSQEFLAKADPDEWPFLF